MYTSVFFMVLENFDVAARIVLPERAVLLAQTSKAVRAKLCAVGGIPARFCLSGRRLPCTAALERLLAHTLVAEIDFCECGLGAGGGAVLARLCRNTDTLRTLALDDCSVTPDTLAAVLSTGARFLVLTELCLRRNTLTSGGEILAQLIARAPLLRTLDVRDTRLTALDTKALWAQLAAMPALSCVQTSAPPAGEYTPTAHLEHVHVAGDRAGDCPLDFFRNIIAASPGLRRLELRGFSWTGAIMQSFAAACAGWPLLEHVDVSFALLLCAPADYAAVLDGLATCTRLVHLRLDVDASHVHAETGTALARVLAQCTRLRYLLPGRIFTATALAACTREAWTLPALHTLEFQGVVFGYRPVPSLSIFTARAHALTRLDLGGNALDWKDANVIVCCSNLTDLSCSFMTRDEPGFRAFTGYLERPSSPLTRLTFLQIECAHDYDTMLEGATSLEVLSLNANSVGKKPLTKLPGLTRLRRLALERLGTLPPLPGNLVALDFEKVFPPPRLDTAAAAPFAILTGVASLVLKSCKLADTLCLAPGLSTLETLDLYGNYLRRPKELLARVASFAELTMLRLEANQLDDAGAAEVAAELPRMPCLRALLLAHNVVGDVGMAALAAALAAAGCVPALARITLQGNRSVTAATGAPMLAALANCACLRSAMLPVAWRVPALAPLYDCRFL